MIERLLGYTERGHFIVDELRRDDSNGSNFKIKFEKEITLEQTVDELIGLLSFYTNKPQSHFIKKQEKYGHIDLQMGELFIKDERRFSIWRKIEKPVHDVYRVIENNMDF